MWPTLICWPFLKMVVWPIRGSSLSSPHWPRALSFSLSLSPFLSPLSSKSHCLTVSLLPLHWRHERTARGGSPAADQHSPRVSAEDELHWLPKVPPLTAVFGKFRRRPTSFHGETTCFETSFQPSTKPCLSWQTNYHRWKADYYSHKAFHGFF